MAASSIPAQTSYWPVSGPGSHELGLTGKYGVHRFEIEDGDRQLVPAVDYRFVRIGLDGRLQLGAVVLGAAVG